MLLGVVSVTKGVGLKTYLLRGLIFLRRTPRKFARLIPDKFYSADESEAQFFA